MLAGLISPQELPEMVARFESDPPVDRDQFTTDDDQGRDESARLYRAIERRAANSAPGAE